MNTLQQASSPGPQTQPRISKRTKPPFRADHVGSLLRPQHLLDARSKFDRGEISAVQLRSIEDDAIRHAVKRQEIVGLKTVTDGGFRPAVLGTWTSSVASAA